MERTHQDLHYHSAGAEGDRVGGFSLVELMVGLAICGFLAIGLWSLMDSQNRTYRLQDNSARMQQNLRAAIDAISRDLLFVGQGPNWPISGTDEDGGTVTTGAWYVGSGSIPYRSVAGQIDIIGCMDATRVATLDVQANAAGTQVTVKSDAGQIGWFPVGTYVSIGGLECAKVTAVSVAAATLTVDTDPSTAGNQGLANSHPTGSYIRPVQWVTYFRSGNILKRDVHDGNGGQVVAEHINALNMVDNADRRMLTLTVTGSTDAPNVISSAVTNTIYRRNR